MGEERKLAVLRAIVEDYVRTHEPVGSKSLAERHNLGVSPATIRNDMAVLEEEGYIAQPHTSAGRVPTDKGYRLFVDRLASVKPLSVAERRAISTFLDGSIDLDDVVARTVRLLAQVTRQAAVVQYPSLTRSSIRHVELVALGASRVMLVLITDTGRVEQRVVECPPEGAGRGAPGDGGEMGDTGDMGDTLVADLRSRLNSALAGVRLADAPPALAGLREAFPESQRPAVDVVLATLMETLIEQREERVVLAGAANLARFGQDFPLTIQPVLDALEEQVVLLRLVGEATTASTVTVRIGGENPEGLTSTAVVSVGYGAGEHTVGGMGVLGPMRMDYPSTMGAVRAVARYVGQILAES